MTLSEALLQELAVYAIVFCRIGAAMMFMPGFGDSTVNMRARLLLALAVSFAVGASVGDPEPLAGGILEGAAAIFTELSVGIFIGVTARMILSALQTAGTIIAAQISMANAISFDAISAQQGALPANFLTMTGVVLLFVTDLRHLLLAGIVASYQTFPLSTPLPVDGFVEAVVMLVSEGFSIGVALSAPFILVGVTVTAGMGLLARLMPQVQVFFIVMPLQIGVGLALLAMTLGAGMRWYMGRFVELQSLVIFGG